MAKGNAGLRAAARAKRDEFYTRREDIEAELRWYPRSFEGKTVLCNCDDPFRSEFFKHFVREFDALGLARLISTCWAGPATGSPRAYRADVTRVPPWATRDDGDVAALLREPGNALRELEGDGDLRSRECVAILDEADVVVTNPPFSLFRPFIATVLERRKSFLIIGNVNAVKYKEVFPSFMRGEMRLGPSIRSGDRAFHVPDDYPLEGTACGVDAQGRKLVRVKGVRWFTDLCPAERDDELVLTARYDPARYPRYDNFDAIEVSRTRDIPCDWPGVMGVPITFIDRYDPEQFELVGLAQRGAGDPSLRTKVYVKGDHPRWSDLNAGPTLVIDGELRSVYSRLLIRNRHPMATGDA